MKTGSGGQPRPERNDAVYGGTVTHLVRRDCAVILARGDSRRMGSPKGLARAGDDDRPFLLRIRDLYAELGWPVAVVTQPDLHEPYAFVLRGCAVRWILRGAGRDTAASVGAALLVLRRLASHLWLHPVDLPGVKPATLARLLSRSRREPEAVLVPAHADQPGHPVVLPTAPLAHLADPLLEGPMRSHLRRWCGDGPDSRAPLRHVAVADPGVVDDHDEPDSVAAQF